LAPVHSVKHGTIRIKAPVHTKYRDGAIIFGDLIGKLGAYCNFGTKTGSRNANGNLDP
jgi:hypothetical protein